MNAGARHASGDVLLFLHLDSALSPGALAELQKTCTIRMWYAVRQACQIRA